MFPDAILIGASIMNLVVLRGVATILLHPHITPSQWVSSKDPKPPEFFLWLTSGSGAWKYVQLNLQRILGVLADL